jgi:hypothetical protein
MRTFYCLDCKAPRKSFGLCEACKAEGRRLLAIHQLFNKWITRPGDDERRAALIPVYAARAEAELPLFAEDAT